MSNFANGPYGQNYTTGGGAAGGGGGFMNSSQGSASGGGGAGGRSGAVQSLRPVTIAQVLSAKQSHAEAEYVIDGAEIGQLTIVGIVRSISQSTTNVMYHIDDGTGFIEIRVWIDAQSGNERYREIKEDTYVRVIGGIKSFQERRHIQHGHMRLVTDPNEIYFHQLQVINTHLALTRGAADGSGANGVKELNGAGGDARFATFENPIERKIMMAVHALAETQSDNTGVAIAAIARRIQGSTESSVRETIENLIGEGYLFTAEDDDHVLSTLT